MWNSGPWNQWPIHASMYQNVPHEQVDWAQLAKQWIQMQQTPSDGGEPQAPPPTGTLPQLPHAGGLNAPTGSSGNFWSSSWGTTDDGSKGWGTGGTLPGLGGAPVPAPSVPLLPLPPVVAEGVSTKETFDYGHTSSAPPLTAHSYDYGHGGPEQYEPVPQVPPYPNTVPYGSYWGVGTGPPPFFLRKDRRDNKEASRHPALEEEVPQIDAAKRKTLPAWIREGLEKMERERQRKEERERAEAERLAKLSKRRGSQDDPSRSKFDSDSEEEEDEHSRNAEVPTKALTERNGTPLSRPSPSPSPPEVRKFRTPEERQQELVMKVRKMLTELLLEVTSEEFELVAKEVIQRALQKAPARQPNSSSALANIASGLGGLTGYGSNSGSSSESSGEEEEDDSDQELERCIREKKLAFAEWEQKAMATLDAADRRLQEEATFSAQKVTGDEVVHSPTGGNETPSETDKDNVCESLNEEGSRSSSPENPDADRRSVADDQEPEIRPEDSDEESDRSDEEEPVRDEGKRNSGEAKRGEEKKLWKADKRRDQSSSPQRRRSRSSPKRRSRSREKKKHSRRSKTRSRSRSSRRSRSRDWKHSRKHSSSRSRSRSRHKRRSRSPKHRSRRHSRSSSSPRERKHRRKRSYSSESEGSGKRSSRRYRDR